MTVLVVLAGLLISHFLSGLARWRRPDWLLWPLRRVLARTDLPAWLPMLLVVAIALIVPAVVVWGVVTLLGLPGWILLALATVVYTLGPRDLDDDVNLLLQRDGPEGAAAASDAAAALRLDPGARPDQAAAAVFHGALSRWFGILFWFVLLGIPGAVLYRLNRAALQMPELEGPALEWLARMRIVLDWPVQALMMIGIGLCGDLDRVWRAWRGLAEDLPVWMIAPVQLDRIAGAIVPAEADFDQGLMAGHRMVWRVLVLWLVVMSLLLLAGWLV